jgi:carbamoyl-phosphate synthase small subunit
VKPPGGDPGDPFRVVVVDCGVKYNILRSLVSRGCRVTVVPAFSTAEEILAHGPDGVVFSNGPGDPERLPRIVEAVRGVMGRVPVFGICLGHQVIGRAFGGRTYKLKFGHHGGNHPVIHVPSGTVAITVQNHNFAVDPRNVEVTHLNLNDRTVEGQRHRELPVFSVQYHPESSPGPHDAAAHFKDFTGMLAAARGGRGREA